MPEIDHTNIRSEAQTEVHDTAMFHADVRGFDRYTRHDATETLGSSWQHIATVYFADTQRVSDVLEARTALIDKGYLVEMDTSDIGRLTFEVSITHDVFERLRQD